MVMPCRAEMKYLSVKHKSLLNGCNWIAKHCNNGTVSGAKIKERLGWKLVVLCGNTFYDVTDKPDVYNNLAY